VSLERSTSPTCRGNSAHQRVGVFDHISTTPPGSRIGPSDAFHPSFKSPFYQKTRRVTTRILVLSLAQLPPSQFPPAQQHPCRLKSPTNRASAQVLSQSVSSQVIIPSVFRCHVLVFAQADHRSVGAGYLHLVTFLRSWPRPLPGRPHPRRHPESPRCRPSTPHLILESREHATAALLVAPLYRPRIRQE
jgi:hypothetical protein